MQKTCLWVDCCSLSGAFCWRYLFCYSVIFFSEILLATADIAINTKKYVQAIVMNLPMDILVKTKSMVAGGFACISKKIREFRAPDYEGDSGTLICGEVHTM